MYVEYGLLIFYILIMCYGMFCSMVALFKLQSIKGFMQYWWSLVNTSIPYIYIFSPGTNVLKYNCILINLLFVKLGLILFYNY